MPIDHDDAAEQEGALLLLLQTEQYIAPSADGDQDMDSDSLITLGEV